MSPDPDRRLLLAVLSLAVLFCLPMWAHPGGFLSGDPYRDNDWLTDRLFDLLARHALLDEHVFPLRSALVGGGYPTVAHPFDGSWAPTLLPVLLLGVVQGTKVNLLLLLLLGTVGTFRLARRWVQLPGPAAAFAAAAFALGGWLPSMMLVGFSPQALLLAAPLALSLLLTPRGPADRVAAGALLFLLLQQAGNALLATVAVCGWTLWLHAAATVDERRGARLDGLLLLLLVCGGPALSLRYGIAWPTVTGWILCALWVARSPRLRAALRAARPFAVAFLAALLVAGSLGAGKLVGLAPLLREAVYAHAGNEPPSWWPRPGVPHRTAARDEHFYGSWPELGRRLVERAPASGTYGQPGPIGLPLDQLDGVDLRSAVGEYGFLGLTPPLLLVAVLGVLFGLRAGGPRGLPALLSLLLLALCLGPRVPLDPYLLLAGGLPGLDGIRQPVKYYSFFLALFLALAAGVGFAAVRERWPTLGRALPLLLLWPLLQNASIWPDRFAQPLPDWACDDCRQVKQIGHRDWASLPAPEIERRGRAVMLRELRPPPAARAYDNAGHGVGTVDWYGTLERPDVVLASHYVTARGEVLPNPHWIGDASVVDGAGRVLRVTMGTLRITLDVELEHAGRVVLNTSYDAGFRASTGTVLEHRGLLALELPAGHHAATLVYRPIPQIAGLLASLLAAVFWGLAWRKLRAASIVRP